MFFGFFWNGRWWMMVGYRLIFFVKDRKGDLTWSMPQTPVLGPHGAPFKGLLGFKRQSHAHMPRTADACCMNRNNRIWMAKHHLCLPSLIACHGPILWRMNLGLSWFVDNGWFDFAAPFSASQGNRQEHVWGKREFNHFWCPVHKPFRCGAMAISLLTAGRHADTQHQWLPRVGRPQFVRRNAVHVNVKFIIYCIHFIIYCHVFFPVEKRCIRGSFRGPNMITSCKLEAPWIASSIPCWWLAMGTCCCAWQDHGGYFELVLYRCRFLVGTLHNRSQYSCMIFMFDILYIHRFTISLKFNDVQQSVTQHIFSSFLNYITLSWSLVFLFVFFCKQCVSQWKNCMFLKCPW